jgi:hypothetical protein
VCSRAVGPQISKGRQSRLAITKKRLPTTRQSRNDGPAGPTDPRVDLATDRSRQNGSGEPEHCLDRVSVHEPESGERRQPIGAVPRLNELPILYAALIIAPTLPIHPPVAPRTISAPICKHSQLPLVNWPST